MGDPGRDGARVERIVSGGQTGADRAALDWAAARGVAHGGWCPRGRRAEDGPIAPAYGLRETPSADYAQRTEWNVRDSDGTVIITLGSGLGGGSRLTAEVAAAIGRPCLHLSRERDGDEAGAQLAAFLTTHGIRTLNVAGPRASSEPGIEAFVARVLTRAAASTPDGGAPAPAARPTD
jgi:hypothetical protein